MDIGSAVRTLRVEPVADPVPRPGGDAETDEGAPWLAARDRGGIRAPDYAEPLIGWRAWAVSPPYDTPTLVAPGTGVEWRARRAHAAICCAPAPLIGRLRLRRAHEAPTARCSCGIRAAADPTLAAAELEQSGTATTGVLGQVALWGTVVECQEGWRAARAYPVRLYLAVPAERSRRAHRLDWLAYRLACYGAPVSVVLDCRTPEELVAAVAATSLPRAAPGDAS